jgi:hypothetical protein
MVFLVVAAESGGFAVTPFVARGGRDSRGNNGDHYRRPLETFRIIEAALFPRKSGNTFSNRRPFNLPANVEMLAIACPIGSLPR